MGDSLEQCEDVEVLGTSVQVEKLAFAQSRIAEPLVAEGEAGVLLELWIHSPHCFCFLSKRKKFSGECVMLVVGRYGMLEDRKKGRNRNLEE